MKTCEFCLSLVVKIKSRKNFLSKLRIAVVTRETLLEGISNVTTHIIYTRAMNLCY